MSEIKVNKISPRTNCGTVTVGDSGDSVSVTAGVPVTINGDLKSSALKAPDGGVIVSQCGTANTLGAAGDTVTVAGNDLRSDAYKAADGGSIISQSGTTITLGASGDTVSLASGASQSGFGRAGSVNWQTGSIKTSTFTAADGEGYFVNTTSGVVTVNLPAGSSGAIVAISDYAQTAATNNITVTANGSEKIEGSTNNYLITTNGVAVTLVYVDATRGWKLVDTGEASSFPQIALFTAATGGTVTTCGNYKIHTFTGPGTFCVSSVGNSPSNPAGGPSNASFLVLAGGGGGGAGYGTGSGGSGGGAGGHRTDFPTTDGTLPLSISAYPITVGGGGKRGEFTYTPPNPRGANGSDSIFSTITSAGGGSGGGVSDSGGPGTDGGSGGGTACNSNNTGSGNTPPVSPPQGNPGYSANSLAFTGGGGGGAGGAATSPTGGPGSANSITGSSVTRGGGGGSGLLVGGPVSNPNIGPGGPGGGGDGGPTSAGPGLAQRGGNGSTNLGGGGGGATALWATNPSGGCGGNGGSGIVIIRYKFQ